MSVSKQSWANVVGFGCGSEASTYCVSRGSSLSGGGHTPRFIRVCHRPQSFPLEHVLHDLAVVKNCCTITHPCKKKQYENTRMMLAQRQLKIVEGARLLPHRHRQRDDGMTGGDTHLDAKRDLPREEGDEEEQGQSSFFELLDAAVATLPES